MWNKAFTNCLEKKNMVYIFSVCYEYKYLFTIIIITHENWPKMLKCWSKSACLKEEHVSIESYKQHELAFTSLFIAVFFFFFFFNERNMATDLGHDQ